jgi:hypothetical protein
MIEEMVVKANFRIATMCVLLVVISAHASAKEVPAQAVDAGAFGVFMNGRRVATERFSVQQTAGGSAVTSQLKAEGSTDPGQRTELKLSVGGDLIRYEWHDLSGNKAELTVAPNDQFLMEHITTGGGEKPTEQPFLMPVSTMVLDNNTFVQRELLLWRYLGSVCKQDGGKTQCSTKATQFGVLVPQERISVSVSLQVMGKEKVKINGADRELLKVLLKQDTGDWTMYVDDQNMYKLMRIEVPGNNTEVVRD